MLSSRYGHLLDKHLVSLARTFNINPNALTVTGFLITTAAALALPRSLFLGGVLILAGGFFDVFDGIVARENKRSTDFGAFLDSVLDRYSDSFLFLGFTWHFYNTWSPTGMFLSLGTMVGAMLISYTRARAEGLGRECQVGLMERPDRVILMALGAITGLVMPVMWVLFILTHITVIQRIHHVWNVMREQK